MSAIVVGRHSWKGSRDNDGHRIYKVRWLVETNDPWYEGPERVSAAYGLPGVGYPWIFGLENDPAAICQPELEVSPAQGGEVSALWFIDQTYSTKPLSDKNNSQQENPQNPLMWMPEISGSFVRFTREAVQDKDGKALVSSSFERFRGAAVERDMSNHEVQVKVFLPVLLLGGYASMIDTVNNSMLWGLSERKVKFSTLSWKINFYAANFASRYYEVTYGLDIHFDTFDFKILDEGTKVLKDGGDAAVPKDYIANLVSGQPKPVLLDGAGKAITSIDDVVYKEFKVYTETNLLTLPGLPASL